MSPEQPLFAFVHLFDPHWEYSPPPPFDRRFIDAAYAGPIDGTLASLAPYFEPSATMSAAAALPRMMARLCRWTRPQC